MLVRWYCDRCGRELDEYTPWFSLQVFTGEDPVKHPWEYRNEEDKTMLDFCGRCEEAFTLFMADATTQKAIEKARGSKHGNA